jgi:hypothetical protein
MLRRIGKNFWRFMVIFSFIVNIILVIVLLVLGIIIFDLKEQIADPLIQGLHSSFVGLDDATIDWTIPVRDTIPVELQIPLQTDTVVILTADVPLVVNASIDLPGINAYNVDAMVRLNLPTGMELPVALDLVVDVNEPLDVSLDVRAVIPLKETQLHDVADNLRLLFEPLAVGLSNLPDDFGGAMDMTGEILRGDMPNLLETTSFSTNPDYANSPWPGYSTTAGVGYDLYTEPVPVNNIAINTGIVPLGGIPLLDELLRPEVYDAGGPAVVNHQATNNMAAMNIDPQFYDGGLGSILIPVPASESGTVTDTTSVPTTAPDLGIIPTSTPGTP